MLYRALALPALLRMDAQTAHETVLRWLVRLDQRAGQVERLRALWGIGSPVTVGGVRLSSPLMLAAGLVKGHGYTDEPAALSAVERGEDIMPGWASVPALVGQVEYGSFTRAPRLGNAGRVIWRDTTTRSTQNRVGLKNPGAVAAASFLAGRSLPPVFGINIAVTPGVDDEEQERRDVIESLQAFISRGIVPSWFTLNISCPNTDDDPHGHQTDARTRALCGAVIDWLGGRAPLWVKVSPDLSEAQYQALMRAFADTGVKAVIATNTLAQPTPDDPRVSAGVGGGRLHGYAVRVTGLLAGIAAQGGYPVDVIGCGGVSDLPTYRAFVQAGARAVQYWSGLIYRGPWLAERILLEHHHHATTH